MAWPWSSPAQDISDTELQGRPGRRPSPFPRDQAPNKRAQTVRTKIINQFNAAFEQYDLLAGPVVPTTAFKIGENAQDPLAMYLADIMTVGVSLAGLPALILPVGKDDENLPIGLQLIAKAKDDYKLLSLARELEKL